MIVRHPYGYIASLLKSYGKRAVIIRTYYGVRTFIVRPPCDCCAFLWDMVAFHHKVSIGATSLIENDHLSRLKIKLSACFLCKIQKYVPLNGNTISNNISWSECVFKGAHEEKSVPFPTGTGIFRLKKHIS